MNNNSISILIVTFYLDFDLLRKHLDSVRLYLDDYTQYPYLIVLNDDVKYLQELQDIVREYPEISIRLLHKNNYSNRYVDALYSNVNNTSEAALASYDRNHFWPIGWYTQQVMKLVAPLEVTTDYCIIMDTKCILNKKLSYNVAIKDGKIYTMANAINYFKDNVGTMQKLNNGYKLFDLELSTEVLSRVRSFGTPFAIKTSYARDLLNYLENKGIFINDLILSNESFDVTLKTFEFFLYSAWTEKYFPEDIVFVPYWGCPRSYYTTDKTFRRSSIT